MKSQISTDRLLLRDFKESDVAGLLDFLKYPRVNCFVSDKLTTQSDALKYIEKQKADEYSMAICLKATDEIIGYVYASKEDEDTYSPAWHLNSKYEGKGYGYEAAQAYLDYLFFQLKARRVYAYVEEDNIRSRNLCERLGMRYEGCMVEFISFVDNPDCTPKYENTCIYAVLKREWNERKTQ